MEAPKLTRANGGPRQRSTRHWRENLAFRPSHSCRKADGRSEERDQSTKEDDGFDVDAVSGSLSKELEAAALSVQRQRERDRADGTIRLTAASFEVADQALRDYPDPVHAYELSRRLKKPQQSVRDALERLVAAELLSRDETPHRNRLGAARTLFRVLDPARLHTVLAAEAIRRVSMAMEFGGYLPEEVGAMLGSYFREKHGADGQEISSGEAHEPAWRG
jgi:predicted transcriptional regulator